VDNLIKYTSLTTENPKFNNTSIIEKQQFIFGIYIHFYKSQNKNSDKNNENELKTFECPICLEKAKEKTNLSVTKCGKFLFLL